MFATLADPEDAEWFAHVLEAAWKAPLGEVDEGELMEILEDFEARTGAVDADDPGSKGFSVVQSAMLGVSAIAVYLNPSPARAEMSGQTLQTILGSFEFKLGGSEFTITPNGEKEEVGRLQKLERDAQKSFMETVHSLTGDQEDGRLDREFLEGLRETCVAVRDEIKEATMAVADLSGWDQE
ncbi:hypothetical protein ACWIID_13300 [Streptomyces phaeochromogenes]